MAKKKLKVFKMPSKGVIPAATKSKKIKGPKVKVPKGWKI